MPTIRTAAAVLPLVGWRATPGKRRLWLQFERETIGPKSIMQAQETGMAAHGFVATHGKAAHSERGPRALSGAATEQIRTTP